MHVHLLSESLDALPRSLGSVGAQTSSVWEDAGTMRNTFLQSEADSVSNSEVNSWFYLLFF